MSDNVEFILSLDDKKFTAAIDRAEKLLVILARRPQSQPKNRNT
jgi:hypothetical protein